MLKVKDKAKRNRPLTPGDPARVEALTDFLKEAGVNTDGIDLEAFIRRADNNAREAAIVPTVALVLALSILASILLMIFGELGRIKDWECVPALLGLMIILFCVRAIFSRVLPIPTIGRDIIAMLQEKKEAPELALDNEPEPEPLSHDVLLGDDGELIDVPQEQKGGSETRSQP